jgi:hypothetical protein
MYIHISLSGEAQRGPRLASTRPGCQSHDDRMSDWLLFEFPLIFRREKIRNILINIKPVNEMYILSAVGRQIECYNPPINTLNF